jgi:hypothetical protein
MPRGTKLQRSGKIAGLRRIYVSWLETSRERCQWIDEFWQRVKTDTQQKDEFFAQPMQTGGAEAGEVIEEWLDPKKQRDPITDIVGVLTNTYVQQNTDAWGVAAEGELARFFDRVLESDTKDRIRVYLAPVDPPNWSYRIRKVELADPERRWLERLKEDSRFVWPSERPGDSADEIASAVAKIIGRPTNG